MLEWAREFVQRLQRNGIAPLEIREETGMWTREQQGVPAAAKGAFNRFLQEYQEHNEEELHHQHPGKWAA